MGRLIFTFTLCVLSFGVGMSTAQGRDCKCILGNGDEDFSCSEIGTCGLGGIRLCIQDECYKPTGKICTPKTGVECNLLGCQTSSVCPNNCV